MYHQSFKLHKKKKKFVLNRIDLVNFSMAPILSISIVKWKWNFPLLCFSFLNMITYQKNFKLKFPHIWNQSSVFNHFFVFINRIVVFLARNSKLLNKLNSHCSYIISIISRFFFSFLAFQSQSKTEYYVKRWKINEFHFNSKT